MVILLAEWLWYVHFPCSHTSMRITLQPLYEKHHKAQGLPAGLPGNEVAKK
jgi:hypothetical protein